MAGKKRTDAADIADVAATYPGYRFPDPMPYALFVGLWLNMPRIWARQAMAVLRGAAGAGSEDDPGKDMFEAVELVPGEGDEAWWASVKARNTAKAKRKIGWQ